VPGGRSVAFRRIAQFYVGASISASIVLASFALAGGAVREVVGLPSSFGRILTGLLLAVSAVWYATGRKHRWFPSSRIQISRLAATRPRLGPVTYGIVLGLVVVTIVASPVVWALVAQIAFGGVPLVGVMASALAFAAGRATVIAASSFPALKDADTIDQLVFAGVPRLGLPLSLLVFAAVGLTALL
jgi:hypothetical protein